MAMIMNIVEAVLVRHFKTHGKKIEISLQTSHLTGCISKPVRTF